MSGNPLTIRTTVRTVVWRVAIAAALLRGCLVGAEQHLAAEPTAARARAGDSSDSNHWAYVAPDRPSWPIADEAAAHVAAQWARNPIDRWTHAAMIEAGFEPSPEADRAMLLRRVTFALTGLPPTADELDAFTSDAAPDAYERAVDRLLASPQHGERLANWWLDLARYADTHGYHTDAHRDLWPWRDWVVSAFNRNLPFDQFATWQLAGDLLPDAMDEQRLATGFHRNTMVNSEEGVIAEEFRMQYVADRVATTGAVFLGQTLDCARCHDHKYDPFTQRDYYRLFAYFNQLDENGVDGRHGNAEPTMPAPTRFEREELAEIRDRLAALEQQMAERAVAATADQAAWEREQASAATALPMPSDTALHLTFDDELAMTKPRVKLIGSAIYLPGKFNAALLFGGQTHVEVRGDDAAAGSSSFALSVWCFPTTADTLTIVDSASSDLPHWTFDLFDRRPRFTLVDGERRVRFVAETPLALRRWQHLALNVDGVEPVVTTEPDNSMELAANVDCYVDGKASKLVRTQTQSEPSANDPPSTEAPDAEAPQLVVGRGWTGDPFRGFLDDLRLYSRQLTKTEVAVLSGGNPIQTVLAIPVADRSAAELETLRAYYLEQIDPRYRELTGSLRSEQRRLEQLRRRIGTTMIMRDRAQPRPTFILERGDYRWPGEQVEPGLPAWLGPRLDAAPPNRLALARWITDRRHPLTARVIVNQLWQLHFSRGLVATPEDFGTRGQPPTHPELLDWLAVEFMDSGWDVRHLIRLIVTSATYRQTSAATPEQRAADPENRWLARGPRFRLPAEMIRDAALATSGLLDRRMGGRGVNPYQPAGLWEAVSYNPEKFTAQVYQPSRGGDLYRRSLYTFWKRASPPPAMTAFDAGDRTVCALRRERTNSPQQSLVLMNDPTLAEAARTLAGRALQAEPLNVHERLVRVFRTVVSREPTSTELDQLHSLYEQQRTHYQNNPEAARELLSAGETPSPPMKDSAAKAPAANITSANIDAADNNARDPAALASTTIVVSTLFLLNETITSP